MLRSGPWIWGGLVMGPSQQGQGSRYRQGRTRKIDKALDRAAWLEAESGSPLAKVGAEARSQHPNKRDVDKGFRFPESKKLRRMLELIRLVTGRACCRRV